VNIKITILLILGLSCSYRYSYGQSFLPEDNYLEFNPAGFAQGQVLTFNHGKQTTVLTGGGFVEVRTAALFRKRSSEYDYLVRYRTTQVNEDIKVSRKINSVDGPVYLKPSGEIWIDILNKKTDNLLKRYVLKRPSLMPQVQFFIKQQLRGNTIFKRRYTNNEREVQLDPEDVLRIKVADRKDFKGLKIEYTLINLKTKSSKYAISQRDIGALSLSPGTDYELRTNYLIQQENMTITYIQVKPYWYQSSLTYLVLAILSLLFAFLWLIKRLSNKVRISRREQNQLEEAAIRLQSQLNPHFTFNALSSIQGLVNTERSEEASYYLEEFSALLRKTLAKSHRVFNSLDQELDMMRTYIRLEALRFNFSWEFEVSQTLALADLEIPTLLFQPLIENAIKHGLFGLGAKGQLTIRCHEGENLEDLEIIVRDNGRWVDKAGFSGYGLSLTNKRILTINKLRKDRSIVLEFNRQDGTEAKLTFKNWIDIP